MKQYHKIQTVFKRDPSTKFKTLLIGDCSTPEIDYLFDNKWVFTEKVDGTNVRVQLPKDGYRVDFNGKTDDSQIPSKLVNVLVDMFDYDRMREVFPMDAEDPADVCLYGEGYGAKIQKGGGNYRPDQSFVLFDVKVGDWWLKRNDVMKVARDLELSVVPTMCTGTLADMVSLCRAGFNSAWGNFRAEGIVARPKVEMFARDGSRIITKLKCKDFENDK